MTSLGLICKHCEKNERPILFVAYTSSDGVFQFLCGEDDHYSVDDADPIHLSHVVEDDPTVFELLQINETFEAERRFVGDTWVIDYNPDID